jgi:hypothetical protein
MVFAALLLSVLVSMSTPTGKTTPTVPKGSSCGSPSLPFPNRALPRSKS